MGVARTTSPTQPTDKTAYKWFKVKGEDGVSNYIHRKYSDFSNGANMSDNSSLKYIGIYTGTSATPPTTASSYLWSKIKGEDGSNGTPGVKGADGRTPYFHTAYSNSATGDRDFSTTNSTGKQYIGTYSDFEVADSTDYRRYKWVKLKGENGERGRDGVDGKSYARNYLSGTADEKVLLAINDNFDVQEAFKLVDNKNFRDLGFKNGDKITFIADYEVLPNGANKKISKLNFEWHDDNRYRVWMEQDINPTKGTYVRTLTIDNDLLDCKRARFRADNVNAKIKITNARVIQGEEVQPWSIAQEDLQAHSLTANLRFEGRYINSITTDVKVYLDVYYDGQKVSSGFDLRLKDKGGTRTDWSDFWNSSVNNGLVVINNSWKNGSQNGQPLELIALVTYKGLNTITNARMENVPDIVEIKEITKKYKTFESTIDRFDSTIGEVKYQTLANEENRNLIIGSRLLSDSEFNVFGKKWDETSQVGIYTEIRQSTSNEIRFLYEGNTYLYVISEHNNARVWQGVGFNLSVNKIRKGQQFTIKIPFYYLTNHENNEGIYAEIKNHKTNSTLWRTRIDTIDIHGDTWDMRAYLFTADRDFDTSEYSFWIYAIRNGGFCISTPYMCEGNKMFSKYSPAPEDVHLQNSRIESSIKQAKDEIDLKVSKDNVIASINASVEKDGQGVNRGLIKINADKVDVTGMLSAYVGKFGNFQLGQHWGGTGQWITGADNFSVGMSDGSWDRTALWVNWGNNWDSAGNKAWYVTPDGRMMAYNTAEFWNIPKVHGALSVTGNIFYGDDEKNPIGMWVYSPVYKQIYKKNNKWLYLTGIRTGEDWITIDSLASDRRIKTNIKESEVNALDVINKFKTYSFTRDYKEQVKDVQLGIMAQDVKEYMYDAFVENPDGIYSYEPFEMIPYLFKAIQELSQENTNLKSQLNEMNERLTKLEEIINGNL